MKHFKFKVVLILLFLVWSTVCFGSSQQTSSTTAATMIDRVEARLNDSDNKMWAAGDLLVWLNEGMLDIAIRTHCLENTDTETLVVDTVEYPITAFTGYLVAAWNYITIKAVHYIDSDSKSWALKKGSPQSVGQAGEDTDTSTPMYWYEWNGSVGVYPPLPNLNIATPETIKVYYITRPTSIESGDDITTPAIYDNLLIVFTMAQAYLRDNQLNRFLQTMGLYEREMQRLRQDLNEHPRDAID